jgi:hypothetical protein
MLDTSLSAGAGLDNIITVLSLLCLFSIMNRNHGVKEPTQTQPAASTNPLHKLLGDLTKGNDGGGVSPETLLSLLPLLNNPQLKSKLNPNTIGTVMGLINSLGGHSGGSSSTEKPKNETKIEPPTEQPKQPKETESKAPNASPQPQTNNSPSSQSNEDMEDTEEKNYGRYLNWKNNF